MINFSFSLFLRGPLATEYDNFIWSTERSRCAWLAFFFFFFFFTVSRVLLAEFLLHSPSYRDLGASSRAILPGVTRPGGSVRKCVRIPLRGVAWVLLFLLLLSLFLWRFKKEIFLSQNQVSSLSGKNILKRQPVNTILHAYAAYDTHRQVVHVRVNISAGRSFYEDALILGSATVSQYLILCRNYWFNLFATPFTSLASLRLATAFS